MFTKNVTGKSILYIYKIWTENAYTLNFYQEYEKLITYSGTPTVVWRRTGEIALVGKEFSLLTQWSRDALLSKKTYIYEVKEKEIV